MRAQYMRSASMSMQGCWQATQALCSLPSGSAVRHIDWVIGCSLRWALLPSSPEGAENTLCTGAIGQKYWHQALPPYNQPTAIATAIVPSSQAASTRRSALKKSRRPQRPANSQPNCTAE